MPSRPQIRSYRISFDFYVTPAVKLLLILNFAVFLVEAFAYRYHYYEGMLKWFGLLPAAVIPGMRIWQPVTYLFLHEVTYIWHILVNMFMLWMFGRELELVWGRNRFLRYYFLTGVGAGVLNVIVKTVPFFWTHQFSYAPTIGASGAVFGVLIACAILFPDRRAYIFPIPVP